MFVNITDRDEHGEICKSYMCSIEIELGQKDVEIEN